MGKKRILFILLLFCSMATVAFSQSVYGVWEKELYRWGENVGKLILVFDSREGLFFDVLIYEDNTISRLSDKGIDFTVRNGTIVLFTGERILPEFEYSFERNELILITYSEGWSWINGRYKIRR